MDRRHPGPHRLQLFARRDGRLGHVLELVGDDIDLGGEAGQGGLVVVGAAHMAGRDVARDRMVLGRIDDAAIAQPRGGEGGHAAQLAAAQDADGRARREGFVCHAPALRFTSVGFAHPRSRVLGPLRRAAGERKGPIAKQWGGEVVVDKHGIFRVRAPQPTSPSRASRGPLPLPPRKRGRRGGLTQDAGMRAATAHDPSGLRPPPRGAGRKGRFRVIF